MIEAHAEALLAALQAVIAHEVRVFTPTRQLDALSPAQAVWDSLAREIHDTRDQVRQLGIALALLRRELEDMEGLYALIKLQESPAGFVLPDQDVATAEESSGAPPPGRFAVPEPEERPRTSAQVMDSIQALRRQIADQDAQALRGQIGPIGPIGDMGFDLV